jgi:hypothetical protein
MKTSDLIGPALDWAVAKCEGIALESFMAATNWLKRVQQEPHDLDVEPYHAYQFSTGWAQGGPIIEREKIHCEWSALWAAWYSYDKRNAALSFTGPTPLIAAMRCYVASKLGDEVDIPEELK